MPISLIDNIIVTFGWRVFQQTVGIPMGTNLPPLLTDLFLYYYKPDFIQELFRKKDKKLARYFNFTFRYIEDVISINNSKFGYYVECINPIELKMKDKTDTVMSTSYLDLHNDIVYIGSSRRNYNSLPFNECDLQYETIYLVCNDMSNTTGATCGVRSASPSRAPEITPSFCWGSCC